MKTTLFKSHLPAIVTAAALLCGVAMAGAAEPDAAVQAHLKRLLTAIEKNDHARFVEDAIPQFKETPKSMLTAVSQTWGSRLRKGYEAEYLTSLRQHTHQAHLWKLTFKDGGDDAVARLIMKEGKVAGFFFQ